MKDEALKLALEALEKSIAITMANIDLRNKAITAIKQALAAQRQCNWPTCQSEEYQQSLAEHIKQELVTGAAQPAVQEPVDCDKVKQLVSKCTHRDVDGNWYVDGVQLVHETCFALDAIKRKSTTPPASQPAPDVTNLAAAIEYADARWSGVDVPIEWARHFADAIGKPYTTPPTQPAVPDATHHTDLSEHPQYIEGWNDCRAETLKGMKP
jgi:hypothetical protein